mgnify:CR=1 FL=1
MEDEVFDYTPFALAFKDAFADVISRALDIAIESGEDLGEVVTRETSKMIKESFRTIDDVDNLSKPLI